MITSLEIDNFIKKYGTRVQEHDNVELIMDDHFCIEYKNVEYYIPENNSFYTEKDEEIIEYLKDVL